MLQTLLAERFRLKLHREMRDLPVYELVIGKGGVKMKTTAPSADGKTPPDAISMSVLANLIAQFLDRPMVDKTGLSGLFKNTWNQNELIQQRAVDQQAHGSGVAPSVFGAVKDQLGLELKPAKDPFEVLVIDSAQRPTIN